MRLKPVICGLFFAALAASDPNAAEECTRDAMIVFDGSGSMAEMGFNLLSEPRIMSARRAVIQSIPEIAEYRRLGLVIYGPGEKEACSNVDLKFLPRQDAALSVIDAIDRLSPSGETPLTSAVELAAEALEYQAKPGIIVLVTDGKETCGGAPCQLAAELKAKAADLTIHVIGFRVDAAHFSFPNVDESEAEPGRTVAKCLADITGGRYASTETVDELTVALRTTLGCAILGMGPGLTRRNG